MLLQKKKQARILGTLLPRRVLAYQCVQSPRLNASISGKVLGARSKKNVFTRILALGHLCLLYIYLIYFWDPFDTRF